MARVRKSEKTRPATREVTVSHRERLIAELRADPKLAAEYLNAVAEDGDASVYLAAVRTVAARERVNNRIFCLLCTLRRLLERAPLCENGDPTC